MRFVQVLLEAIASATTRHRWVTLGITLALTVFFALQLPKVRADFSPQALFASEPGQERVADEFRAVFGNSENTLVVLVQAEDALSPASIQWAHQVARHFEEHPDAERVASLTTTNLTHRLGDELKVEPLVAGEVVTDEEVARIRAEVDRNPLLQGTLVSRDRTIVVVAMFIDRDRTQIAQLVPVVESVETWLAANPPPAGVTWQLAGLPRIRTFVVEHLITDQLVLIPLTAVMNIVVLFFTFLWIPAMVLPIAVVGLTALLVVGGMGLVDEPFNIINNVLPTLVIVIGISDSIHLINRYREDSLTTADRTEAIRRTVLAMGLACFLTSFTTAIGFGSLFIAHTPILARFGVSAAIGVMIAYVVTITALPAVLTFFGSPPKPKEKREGDGGTIERIATAVVDWAVRMPGVALGGVVFLFAALVAIASQIHVDTKLLELFDEDDEMYLVTNLVEEKLDGVLPLEIFLRSPTPGRFDDPAVLNAVIALRDHVAAEQGILSATTYTDHLREAWVAYTGDASKRTATFETRQQVASLASLLEGSRPSPIEPYVTLDRRQMRIAIKVGDVGGKRTREITEGIQAEVRRLFGGYGDVQVLLTGDAYTASLGLGLIMSDLSSSLVMAIVLIFGTMTLLFRSLRMGLISVGPNLFPLVAVLAYMPLRGVTLNTTTLIIFSISLGLAVDNTIHYMTRFKEEIDRGADRDGALHAAGRGTGRAMLVASFLLVAGLAVVMFSSFLPVRLFAELTSVTVISALIGDMVLLPALLRLFWKDTRRAPAIAAPG